MIISIFFFIVAYLVGRAIIKLFKLDLGNIIHPVSMVLGLVFLCLLFYVEGMVFGSLEYLKSLITLIGLMVIVGVVMAREMKIISLKMLRFARSLSANWRIEITVKKLRNIKTIFIPLLFTIFIIWFFGRSLFFGVNGEIIAGDRLVWVDWPLHIGMAANFAFGANFPAQNPHFAGNPLTYPFMADFLSGILLSLGVSLPLSFVLPGIVLTLSFFWIFVGWTGSFWRPKAEESKIKMRSFSLGYARDQDDKTMTKMPYLALIISLFWGGLGWIYWLKDVFASDVTFVANLLNPSREYTFWAEKGLWFFTFLYSEILPQRAFLFGLPLFFLILYLVKQGWEKKQNKYLFVAGILGGLLPFFHTHTFISLWMLSGSVVGLIVFKVILNLFQDLNKMPKQVRHDPSTSGHSIRNIPSLREYEARDDKSKLFVKSLISYFAPFLILTLMQLPFFSSKTLLNLPFAFGWMKGKENFFLFWFMNTGLFVPLWFLGFWKGKFSNFAKIIGASSWILFILPNLFQFAAWGYDNLKIITFWYVIGSVFVVVGLKQISRIRIIGQICAVVLFLSLTLSGFLEISRLIHTSKTQITLWSSQDQELAEIVKQKTSSQSVFLTAAIHDHPIEALAGRKIILGYPGNSWSWGIEGWDVRERDVHIMFQGGEQAKILWKKYAINYIIVSDRERGFEPKLDEEFIKQNSELVLEKDGAKLYRVN